MNHAIIHLREELQRLKAVEAEIQASYRDIDPPDWRRMLNQNRAEQHETMDALQFLVRYHGPVK